MDEALESVRSAMATDARDWSRNKTDAWLYAVLVGWGDALDEVADRHGWSTADRERLFRMRAALAPSMTDQGKCDHEWRWGTAYSCVRCGARRHGPSLTDEVVSRLVAERDEVQRKAERLENEARTQAQERRTANSQVREVAAVLGCKTWEVTGERVLRQLDELRAEVDRLRSAWDRISGLEDAVSERDIRIAELEAERDKLQAEVEAQEQRAELHARINETVSQALGQDFGETWHDLGDKVAALREQRDELLEALRQLAAAADASLTHRGGDGPWYGEDAILADRMDRARAAIAKATGGER